MRRPVGEAFPGPALLAEARVLGIPLVLGSDAHRPGDVGHGFADAAVLAREAGYTGLLRLSTDGQEALA
jgi:histidinol-phosphatase (PHP family)